MASGHPEGKGRNVVKLKGRLALDTEGKGGSRRDRQQAHGREGGQFADMSMIMREQRSQIKRQPGYLRTRLFA